jgi:type I restriction enzyme M protein
MTADHLTNIEKFNADLWKVADELRANSNLASNEYFLPIMGLLFLRQATNRYYEALAAIRADQAVGKMPDRELTAADFLRRRAMMLPEAARYDLILEKRKDGSLGERLIAAMDAVEEQFPPLSGQLPKDYARFENEVLENMMRKFDTEALRKASGDVFGRIYEYFLGEFSKQKAHDNGEFFTPPSIVQTIVNVIEPEHGIILDPACGSGGMFVQSSHFIEDAGQDTMKRVTFYGHEKNETTAKLAQINLAVHGLQGSIRAGNEAITYYKDPHELVGKCDFVMANPPFNVDEVDAEKTKADKKRLPFGLPGVNKEKKVSNANYLWISYFYSYLNENGRAGFVMSSQASSAGRDEATVRQKLVESGAVDVMIDIRGNFFYTRTVPCQLWFLDHTKERDPERAEKVLMLDARNIFRKVSRSLCDFSPEQQKNIAAIVWLYRGQMLRFLKLVESYVAEALVHGAAAKEPLAMFSGALGRLIGLLVSFVKEKREPDPVAENWIELNATQASLTADIAVFGEECDKQVAAWAAGAHSQRENSELHTAREGLHPLAERCRDLTKQIDLAAKVCGRIVDVAVRDLNARESELWANGEINKARKALEEVRRGAVEALRLARYFVKQADWLQDRFPDAQIRDVAGLVKVVGRADISGNGDWSLTPGRYVEVAPDEVDEDFDFEEALSSIRIELKGLNEESAELSSLILRNLEELGA